MKGIPFVYKMGIMYLLFLTCNYTGGTKNAWPNIQKLNLYQNGEEKKKAF